MNFDHQKKENYTLVNSHVVKLDAENAPDLKALFVVLNKNSESNFVLDLSQSKYCDSSGLSAILIGNRLCKSSGGIFVLSGLQANVKKLIEISQLNQILNIVETPEEAEKIFAKAN